MKSLQAFIFFTAGFLCMCLTACQEDAKKIRFTKYEVSDSVLLVANCKSGSPVCKASIALTLLQADSANQYARQVREINRYIIDKILVTCEGAAPEKAAEVYVTKQMKEFTSTVKDLYYEDLKMLDEQSHLPQEQQSGVNSLASSYNYTFNVESEAKLGYADSVVCFKLKNYEFTGGAHGMTVETDVTFSLSTGHPILPEQVFKSGSKDQLIKRLTQKLMDMKHVKTQEQLREIGYLDISDMFISQNMLLEKDSIKFHYDPYDIAPYVFGDLTISFSYQELRDIMN